MFFSEFFLGADLNWFIDGSKTDRDFLPYF